MPKKRPPEKHHQGIAITQHEDGYWHAWVTVGTKAGGAADRRHVKRATRDDVADRIDVLLEQKRANAVVKPGRALTLEQWMEIYLDGIPPSRCDPATVYDYRSKMKVWVYPFIGKTPVDQLEPEHLEDVYNRMERAGRAPTTVLKVHRVLTRALKIALRRRRVSRNVAELLDSPETHPVEQSALTLPEAHRVLAAARGGRNPARWSAGLALGLRQGEALGLRWAYVDLDAQKMNVWWQLRRRSFEHGCNPRCGRTRGGNCPDRTLQVLSGETLLEDGLILKKPKGTGRRTIHVPDELCEELRAHKAGQDLERILAGEMWVEHDLVFARADGGPVKPDHDYRNWVQILKEAKVDHTRLHNGRHTAGTIMLALGADITTVQEVLGHSDIRTTRGYVHVATETAKAATQSIGSALLGRPGAP